MQKARSLVRHMLMVWAVLGVLASTTASMAAATGQAHKSSTRAAGKKALKWTAIGVAIGVGCSLGLCEWAYHHLGGQAKQQGKTVEQMLQQPNQSGLAGHLRRSGAWGRIAAHKAAAATWRGLEWLLRRPEENPNRKHVPAYDPTYARFQPRLRAFTAHLSRPPPPRLQRPHASSTWETASQRHRGRSMGR